MPHGRRDAPNAHALLDIRGRYPLAKADNKLRNLLDVNDVLVLLVSALLTLQRACRVNRLCLFRLHGVHGDNLRTPRNLEWVLLRHTLPIRSKIPKVWSCETGLRLLDA